MGLVVLPEVFVLLVWPILWLIYEIADISQMDNSYRDRSFPRRMRYLEVATSEMHGKCVLVLSSFHDGYVSFHSSLPRPSECKGLLKPWGR